MVSTLTVVVCISCSNAQLSLNNTYSGSKDGYYTVIEFKPDSTIELIKDNVAWPKKCIGEVSFIEEKKYRIKCSLEEMYYDSNEVNGDKLPTLKSHKVKQEYILTIINRKKIRIEGLNAVLKKVR